MPLKVALMTGRLNKAIEDDGNPNTIPAYRRMGYGAHLKWEKERYKVGLIGFMQKMMRFRCQQLGCKGSVATGKSGTIHDRKLYD
jgi:hypothetical protein